MSTEISAEQFDVMCRWFDWNNGNFKDWDSFRHWFAQTIGCEIYERNDAGCCWHLVLDDGNTDDGAVDVCAAAATTEKHKDCLSLVWLMRTASPTERDAVVKEVQAYAASR